MANNQVANFISFQTWGHTPIKRGFKSYTGYLQAQGDYYKHNFAIDQLNSVAGEMDGYDFWHNTRPYWKAEGNYSLDVYRKAMSDILYSYAERHDTPEKKADHPLFVYLAHQTVHIPLQARQVESRCDGISSPARKIYCHMMVELDDSIGELVAQYKSLEMWDDLLILTMTDNGGMVNFNPNKENEYFPIFPASQGSNYPLRGSKTTLFEGGVRALAFASGGHIPKEARGRRLNVLAHAVDFSATVLTAAQVLPAKRETLRLDGFSLYGNIMGSPDAIPQRDHVPINIVLGGRRYSAVRFGRYKLIVDDFLFPAAQGWFDESGNLKEAPTSTPHRAVYVLFNVKDDPEERDDISAQNPSLVEYGKSLISNYVRGGHYMEPQESTKFALKALPFLHRGVWAPFMDEAEWQAKFQKQRDHNNERYRMDESNDAPLPELEGEEVTSFETLAAATKNAANEAVIIADRMNIIPAKYRRRLLNVSPQ